MFPGHPDAINCGGCIFFIEAFDTEKIYYR